MIKKVLFLVVTFVFFISILSIFAPVQSASAGLNGQQLEIKAIMGRGAKVVVTGKNNYGQNANWTFYTPGTPSQLTSAQGETLRTTGYWWVGTVEIRVYWPSSTRLAYACKKDVPKTQFSNWTTAVVGHRNSTSTWCG
jgi:hypothetical protein